MMSREEVVGDESSTGHENLSIQFKKHLVTASYIDNSLSTLDERAKSAGITILGEMGLDPGIDPKEKRHYCRGKNVIRLLLSSDPDAFGPKRSPSWNPAGAIRAGRNPATYKSAGKIVHVDGNELYDSAARLQITDLPAFALECLPNRNSLIYGDLYGITHEASTIFRGTLRYEGMLFIWKLIFVCQVEVDFPNGRPTENQRFTLLEFGKMKNGKTTTAMALTVGIPAAIGSLLLLENRIKTRGVIRPFDPEVYEPALDILEAYGFKLLEKIE
ncbi:hypothetical protein NE237_028975 [Protea cynaroides]|uniref:Saccharopine dehydrogenase-like C-terminal domain-containing protein n=1 Tax=Protea cynaroides TaxID=273540 RepID=A0A9Q0JVT3_9MAGN|nr:hypothetical protein NE237_028975 [Protea cynaroides]